MPPPLLGAYLLHFSCAPQPSGLLKAVASSSPRTQPMGRLLVVGVALVLSACSSARPDSSRSAHVADCGYEQAVRLGYTLVEGEIGSGMIKMTRSATGQVRERQEEGEATGILGGAMSSDRQATEQITLIGRDSTLQIHVLALDRNTRPVMPRETTLQRTQRILAACGSRMDNTHTGTR